MCELIGTAIEFAVSHLLGRANEGDFVHLRVCRLLENLVEHRLLGCEAVGEGVEQNLPLKIGEKVLGRSAKISLRNSTYSLLRIQSNTLLGFP